MNKAPICQSCGMPMSDSKLVATNADHSANEEYCIYCYKEGAFTKPDATLEEMVNISVSEMKKQAQATDKPFNDVEMTKMLENYFPTLNRWRNS